MSLDVYIETGLLNRLKRGEERAFRLVYERLYTPLFSFVNRWVKDESISEEIVQEAFIAVWMSRHTLESPAHLIGLAFKVARRMSVDHFRSKMLEIRASEHLSQVMTAVCNQTSETVIYDDLENFANLRIDRLPPQQQAVFKMNRREGLSYEEIANRLQISHNTVRNHMVCALKSLRLQFTKHVLSFLFVFYPFVF